MKLYNTPIFTGESCGVTCLAVLTRKKLKTVRNELLAFRKTQKPYRDEWVSKGNFYHDTEVIYYREVRHFLKPFTARRKIVHPKKQSLKSLVLKCLDPKKFYAVWSTWHIQIVHNGRVWDTVSQGGPVKRHIWNDRMVKGYIALDKPQGIK